MAADRLYDKLSGCSARDIFLLDDCLIRAIYYADRQTARNTDILGARASDRLCLIGVQQICLRRVFRCGRKSGLYSQILCCYIFRRDRSYGVIFNARYSCGNADTRCRVGRCAACKDIDIHLVLSDDIQVINGRNILSAEDLRFGCVVLNIEGKCCGDLHTAFRGLGLLSVGCERIACSRVDVVRSLASKLRRSAGCLVRLFVRGTVRAVAFGSGFLGVVCLCPLCARTAARLGLDL